MFYRYRTVPVEHSRSNTIIYYYTGNISITNYDLPRGTGIVLSFFAPRVAQRGAAAEGRGQSILV